MDSVRVKENKYKITIIGKLKQQKKPSKYPKVKTFINIFVNKPKMFIVCSCQSMWIIKIHKNF